MLLFVLVLLCIIATCSGLANSKHKVDISWNDPDHEANLKLLMYYIRTLDEAQSGKFDGASECGNWQAGYTKLHRDMRAGRIPPRWLISIAPPQGLADRLGGIITQFLFALLTNRAFVMASLKSQLDYVYDSPNINTAVPPELMPTRALYNLTFGGYPAHYDKNKLFGLYLNAGAIKEQYYAVEKLNRKIFLESNLSEVPEGYAHTERLFVMGNRGYSYRIHENRYHTQQLADLGLTPVTTFKCVYDYLFRLKPETCGAACQSTRAEMERLKRMEDTMIIGLQVRLGDHVFDTRYKKLSVADRAVAQQSFKCAKKIMKKIWLVGRKVRVFIISDSQFVKKMATRSFGKLLLDTELNRAQALHVHESTSAQVKRTQADALRLVVSDITLYSMAHIHVISRASGLGQKASFLSSTRNKLFLTPTANRTHVFIGDMGENCTPVSTIDLVSQWSGI